MTEVIWRCDHADCPWSGARYFYKQHMQLHSEGKLYCHPCNRFFQRLDKHVLTATHLKAVANMTAGVSDARKSELEGT